MLWKPRETAGAYVKIKAMPHSIQTLCGWNWSQCLGSLIPTGLYHSPWFIVLFIALHFISCLVLYCYVVQCTVHYCLFSYFIFSFLATSSIKLNLNLKSSHRWPRHKPVAATSSFCMFPATRHHHCLTSIKLRCFVTKTNKFKCKQLAHSHY